MKTNAARILDSLGIRYALRSYEVRDEHAPARVVDEKVGLPPDRVFKTLVAREIVIALGGAIRVESQPERGATFTVGRLPGAVRARRDGVLRCPLEPFRGALERTHAADGPVALPNQGRTNRRW